MTNDLAPRLGRPRPDRPRRRTRIVLISVGIVVVAAMLAAGGYIFYSYQHFVSGVTHVNAITSSNAPKHDIDGKDQNILLVGDDHRPANATAQELVQLGTQQDGGGLNTDTMMVMHVPANGVKATLISFPRDSWVAIPGFGMNKLNAAFEFGTMHGGGDAGGAQLLIRVIQNMTGLTIDHFVRVSMLGFYNIAEALGPINVCLKAAVNDPYSTVDLPKGVSSLNAQQALAFVRQRHGLANGDLDREVRQQYFLSVEARRVLSAGTLLNPVKLQRVLDAVSASLETDPGLNFLTLAAQLHGLNANNLTSATIPVSGTPTIKVGRTSVSIVRVDSGAMPAFIAGITGVPSGYSAAKASKASSVLVTVVNGSGVAGAGLRNTKTLSSIGFETGVPTTARSQELTTIEYPAGMAGDAKALAAHVPGADVGQSASVDRITLVLGTDGRTVLAAAPVPSTAPNLGSSNPGPSITATPASTAPTSPAKNFAEGACIN